MMAMLAGRRGDKRAALDWHIRALEWLSRNATTDADLRVLQHESETLLGRSPAADLGSRG